MERTTQNIETYRQSIQLAYEYPLVFTRAVFSRDNPLLASAIRRETETPRALAFFDRGLLEAWPDLVRGASEYLAHHAIDAAGEPVIVPGGESVKDGWAHVHFSIQAIARAGLCRHSYVLVVGGGAVLDAIGLAASLVHRGIRLIRIPTTTLSQGDSGVGVKNGINHHGQKNFIGAFAPPWAVINDRDFLTTLDRTATLDGVAEAFKVAIIKDRAFFDFLGAEASKIAKADDDVVAEAVRRSAILHLDHIRLGGDPFEMGEARPLDFGHWAAHHLESASGYRISHGQGVAIGIAIDAIYAQLRGLIAEAECDAILTSLTRCGMNIWDPLVAQGEPDRYTILDGIQAFREHLGGRLSITLPRGIGDRVEVNEIDDRMMTQAIARLREYATG